MYLPCASEFNLSPMSTNDLKPDTDEKSVDMNSRKTWMLEQIGQSLPDTRDVMVASHLWPLLQIHETF